MGLDLPPATWTQALIGPGWPAPPAGLRDAAQYRKQACGQQEQYAQDLRNQRTVLTAHNQGRRGSEHSSLQVPVATAASHFSGSAKSLLTASR